MTAEKNISVNHIELETIKEVYFIGIGGIGMSALARYFNSIGKDVHGYDKTQTELTNSLESEGINIHFEDNVSQIPESIKTMDKTNVLVVYTPAIPNSHQELKYLKNNAFTILKRSQALGIIVSNTKGLAVAGTHGKTTTSSILAHILKEYNEPISAFLGGIASNFNSNFIHEKGAITSVVEADEYDRSFLTLHPWGAIITSTDADHLDIYGEKDALLQSFKEFINQTSDALIVNERISGQLSYSGNATFRTYGWNSSADYQITSRTLENGSFKLNIKTPSGHFEDIVFPMAGKHNCENALAALALASEYGLNTKKLAAGLESFQGIKRRFETLVNTSDHVYIDDYAHHPTELDAAISAAKELHPLRRLVGIFQPHLYSRTRDFATKFAKSLSNLDQLILLDIYPARELPIPGVTSEWLLEKVTTEKLLLSKAESIKWVKENQPSLLLTLGAGDIDQLIQPIKQILS